MAWLRLIRWPNLLIILLTQGSVWLFIIMPIRGLCGAPNLNLDEGCFLWLSLSTICIAAAGYIINDYFDVRIDAINHPQKVILGKDINRRIAIILHVVLNIIALVFAFIVAVKVRQPGLICFQLLCILSLWLYSTRFKQKFAWGNIVVSIMTTLTVVVVGAYEPLLSLSFLSSDGLITGYFGQIEVNPVYRLASFAFFAGMMTWMREIVKDMEDIKGDAEEGCDTMPIRWGLERTATFTKALSGIVCAAIVLIAVFLYRAAFYFSAIYLLLAVMIPLMLWTRHLSAKFTAEHYAKASRMLKIFMIAGILALLVLSMETNSKWTYVPQG